MTELGVMLESEDLDSVSWLEEPRNPVSDDGYPPSGAATSLAQEVRKDVNISKQS
ncbi:MAG: hypothetical protein RIB93_04060 [Coleofasciculus sp. D1-CHI-01]|uniref:hypothetical protein n=1 Tax=Coleofasciculus sp. D1-CHI-01 TaxID=3068482 RepID=UPI0032F507A3